MTDKTELESVSNTHPTPLPADVVSKLCQPYNNRCPCLFFALSKMEEKM